MKIIFLNGREILDSRGIPTLEATLQTEQGFFKASIPSGTSRGQYEAWELRDGDERFGGQGVLKAVKNVKEIIAAKITGAVFTDLRKLDQALRELDGTDNKKNLGANAILSVSMAAARALAAENNLPLYGYLATLIGRNQQKLFVPRASFNVINGGRHAGSQLNVQEFMIVPEGESFPENYRSAAEIYQHLKINLVKFFGAIAVNVGQEGGFAPPLSASEQGIELLLEAAEKAGWKEKIKIALDVAASEFYQSDGYHFEGSLKSAAQMADIYQTWLKKYPLIFLEDPFAENDLAGWKDFRSKNQGLLIIGDDLLATNPKRIEMAKNQNLCNGLILKPNQIGTVTESIEAARLAQSYGWKVMVSHRSGDTCDDFIADLAVGIGAEYIKSGAPSRGERVVKYNRLQEIYYALNAMDET